jgi:hypothetical protein
MIYRYFELITDVGYLNNPYRSVRFLNSSGGYSYQSEVYPNTRTSHALGLKEPHKVSQLLAVKSLSSG